MARDRASILIAEDEAVQGLFLRTMLERSGFAATVACDGDQAWEWLQAGEFDLLITDYEMPKMSGEAICRHCRQHPRLNPLPVLMLTGKGFELDVRGLQAELGLQGIFFKPLSPRALLHAVEGCLPGKAATA